MSHPPDPLFNTGHLDGALDQQRSKALEAVRKTDADRILSSPVEDLVDETFDEYVINPIDLRHESRSTPGVRDTQVQINDFGRMFEVEGSRFELHIPFEGDRELLRLRPNQYTLSPPRVEVRGNVLVAAHEGRAPLNPEAARTSLNSQISAVEKYLGWQRSSINAFNDELRNLVRNAIETRRAKVLSDRQLEAFLDVPVQSRPGAATNITTSPRRRRRKPTASTKAASPFTPEPALDDKAFGEIIEVIRATTEVMERLPRTAGEMGEESLRDLILIGLNNQFGPATAESFNGRGKTDIYLPVEDSRGNVFIAECKIWKGPAGIRKAIDQLLGYLTWRDTKAALIVFQRSGSPEAVRAKMQAVFRAHDSYKRDRGADGSTFTLGSVRDPAREIHIAVLLVPLLQ